jgi:hypothetical protein
VTLIFFSKMPGIRKTKFLLTLFVIRMFP